MRRLVSLITMVTIVFIAYSQDDSSDVVDAQRPTLTESYSILALNILQFENGIDYYENSNTWTYGTFVRGSVVDRIELRAFTDYKDLNAVGAKFVVMEPAGTVFKIRASFIYNRDILNSSNDYRIAMTKALNSVFVTYNFGYNDAIYNIALLGVPIGHEFSYFIEYYNAPAVNRIHSGFTWIPLRDVQFDINGGWIDSNEWYAGLGVSFRLR